MTRLRPEGEVVEAIPHPQHRDADSAYGMRSAGTLISDWYTLSPGWYTPVGFVWQGTSYYILAVCNYWQVHTRWWEPDQVLWREYLKVLAAPAIIADRLDRGSDLGSTSDGFLGLLYHDLLLGDWFLARVYD
jgi:hypothetical protein